MTLGVHTSKTFFFVTAAALTTEAAATVRAMAEKRMMKEVVQKGASEGGGGGGLRRRGNGRLGEPTRLVGSCYIWKEAQQVARFEGVTCDGVLPK